MSEESKSKPRKRLKILSYLSTVSLEDDVDLAALLGLTAITLVFIITPYLRDSVIRSVLGVMFMLFVPGYTLVAALFPKKDDLSIFERLALSFGLSVATVPLIAMVLGYSPLRITIGSIFIALAVASLFFMFTAKKRRDALLADKRFAFGLRHVRGIQRLIVPDSNVRFDRIVSFVLVISILTTATAFAYVIVMPKQGEHFTDFYILGPERRVDNYPTSYQLNQQRPIIVGVVNHEHRDATYTFVVTLNDSINQHTLHSEQLTLVDGQTWEETVLLQPDLVGSNMKMAFLLYLNDNLATPYRENYLWVNVTQSA